MNATTMINEKDSSRITWIDIAKFIGIFAIVFGHTVTDGTAHIYVYSFHVPLFFFIQGLVFSISKAENRKFGTYVKNKAFTYLLPYYIFAILSTVLIYIMFKFINDPREDIFNSASSLVWGILSGYCEANRPLWFLPCSFVIALTGYGIIKLSLKYTETMKKVILLVGVIISICYIYLNEYFFHIVDIFWKLDIVLPMMTFWLTGYAFHKYKIIEYAMNLSKPKKIIIAVLLIVIGAVSGLWNGRIYYLSNIFGNIAVFYLSAFLSITGICLLCMCLPDIKYINHIGTSTLSILLMHKFPILLFQKIIPFTKIRLEQFSVPTGIVVTIISIIMCCIAQIILEKLCPWMIGKYTKNIKTQKYTDVSV